MRFRFPILVGLVWGLCLTPSPAQEAKTEPPSEDFQAFATLMQKAEQRIRSAKGSNVRVQSHWVMKGDEKDRDGRLEIKMLAQGRDRFLIEKITIGGKTIRWIIGSDGKRITRSLPGEKLHSISETTSPIDDLQTDRMTISALQTAGVDFLVRPEIQPALLAETLEVEERTPERETARSFHLTLADGRQMDITFSAEAIPVPTTLKLVKRIPFEDKQALVITIDTKLTWNLDAPLPASAFEVPLAEGSELVEDISDALVERGSAKYLGQPAPAVTFTQLDGKPLALETLQGKSIIVIYAWATWCAPSIDVKPAIDQFRETYTAKGVKFISVNAGETLEQVNEFIRKTGYKSFIVLDPKGTALGQLNVPGVPSLLIIGKDGTIQGRYITGKAETRAKIAKDLDRLLNGENLVPKR